MNDGDEIAVGDHRFVFDRQRVAQVMEAEGVQVDVVRARREVGGGRVLLHDVSLSVLPGELVAIVGGSGAGKTTLMDAMSGVHPATSGEVRYDGRDYYAEIAQYRHTLGYVPQDDIIHREMPLRLTLEYAARLRLPRDTPRDAIERAVDEALDELGLAARADVQVGTLSGGQRKRASIGIELLTQPRIFYLDEPTSGLDPGTDRQMMELLRKIADDGRTVVLTTHATANVKLCDKIVVLARDGHLAFYGTPDETLRYFGATSFDQIYDSLADEMTPEEWGERFRATPAYAGIEAGQTAPRAAAGDAGGGRRRSRGLGHSLHQFSVLSRRNFDLYARHPSSFVPLVMQPVVFTLLLLALFKTDLFTVATANPNAALQLVYIFAFMVFLFGLLFGVQEIVKERAIFFRERMVNVGVVPYLLSKTSFLAPLLVVCVIGMTVLLRITDRLPDRSLTDVYIPLIITLSLTALRGPGAVPAHLRGCELLPARHRPPHALDRAPGAVRRGAVRGPVDEPHRQGDRRHHRGPVVVRRGRVHHRPQGPLRTQPVPDRRVAGDPVSGQLQLGDRELLDRARRVRADPACRRLRDPGQEDPDAMRR